MPFVTGGFAWGQTKYSLGCDTARVGTTIGGCTKVGAFEDSNKKTVTGWTAGAGLEYAVTDNWTVKGEYLHKNFGKNGVRLTDINFPTSDVNNRNFKTKVNEVRIGVNYKF
ncbi:putative outer membrane protein [Pseudochrobactrum asaccharolyticum]|uniref:Putative outer membrane protein n=1 Tax=Pseudochrobactrum asaccharolyticum TaxID=354351 RepID=A0A366E802_9HYPH|nr:putative outer membrane protein [Pseudochrobactrum asaccharolyticum]